MPEILVVPDPHQQVPAAVTTAACRRAAADRWPSATFPETQPSLLLTVWVPEEDLLIDLHPSGVALTVNHPGQVDGIARWWAQVLGSDVWITDVSGVGYTSIGATG